MGEWAPDIFVRGQRIRAYVKAIDTEFKRIKLTADRPQSLPKVPIS